MRRFFINQSGITGRRVSLTGQDAKHMMKVLRLAPGDSILLFDGSGNEYLSTIENMRHDTVNVVIKETTSSRSESPIQLIAAQAILKDRKMDALVRQLTELGVSKWIPFFAERSVPRPDADRMAKRLQRWEKIAKESLKQCGRGCLPEIDLFHTFDHALTYSGECELNLIFHQDAADALEQRLTGSMPQDMAGKKIFLMFGPEGGFTADEADLAVQRGFKAVRIGPRVLRAETAPVAACAVIQYIFGDMGGNNS